MLIAGLLTALLVAPAAGAPPSDPVPLRDAATAAGASWPLADVWIHIDKSDRSLVLYSGKTAVKRYRAGLGDPVGDKTRQGDRKTPEGTFRVVTRNPRSRFHLFLGLGYPTAEDAERGLAAGLVTQAQATRIQEADAARRQPPWNTALGGAIGIHGEGGSSDWTLGCIAVENAEIEELWSVVPMGTRVVVAP
ncbi:MAG: L,D-transpeptidase [Myxococcota bacterium]|nr:L,D-transpeptidase [Myxococcota bacterium]